MDALIVFVSIVTIVIVIMIRSVVTTIEEATDELIKIRKKMDDIGVRDQLNFNKTDSFADCLKTYLADIEKQILQSGYGIEQAATRLPE